MLLIGVALVSISVATGSLITGGVILSIGPIPVIVGGEPTTSNVTLISLLIVVAIILLLLVSYLNPRKIYVSPQRSC
jgi:uncharacterized membrane protein